MIRDVLLQVSRSYTIYTPPPPPTYKLFSYGANGNGQLGLNDLSGRSSPVQVGSLTEWKQIDGGEKVNMEN
jgi:Regulator of chromosome condensation (RCC1) repeat